MAAPRHASPNTMFGEAVPRNEGRRPRHATGRRPVANLVRFPPLPANPQIGCKVQLHPQYLSPVSNPFSPGQRLAPEQEAVMSANSTLGTRQKALALNLDGTTYGTLAEIGGGQE